MIIGLVDLIKYIRKYCKGNKSAINQVQELQSAQKLEVTRSKIDQNAIRTPRKHLESSDSRIAPIEKLKPKKPSPPQAISKTDLKNLQDEPDNSVEGLINEASQKLIKFREIDMSSVSNPTALPKTTQNIPRVQLLNRPRRKFGNKRKKADQANLNQKPDSH